MDRLDVQDRYIDRKKEKEKNCFFIYPIFPIFSIRTSCTSWYTHKYIKKTSCYYDYCALFTRDWTKTSTTSTTNWEKNKHVFSPPSLASFQKKIVRYFIHQIKLTLRETRNLLTTTALQPSKRQSTPKEEKNIYQVDK